MRSKGLGNRAFRAAAWLYGLRIVSRVLGLARSVILARLLMPADFGLVSVAMLTIGVLEVFTRSGLRHSVVQKEETSRHELHAIWTFDLLRGIVLGLAMFLSAPYIGAFMNSPGSVPVVRAMAVVPPLMFLRNIDLAVIWRDLETRKMFLVEAAGQLASVVVGISLAVIYQSVWALVLSAIANHLIRIFMSYLVSPSRPRFVWDWSIVRYHLRYGRQILATAITQYSYNNADDWFVGKVLGASALGLYGKAYQWGNMPTTELTLILARVLFPSFSKLKKETDRLGKAFLRVQRTLSILVAPVTALLFLFSRPLVYIVLGDRWLEMVPAFRILVLWGGLRAYRESAIGIFRAIGWPALIAWTTLGKLIVMLALLWPASRYGIVGVGVVVLLTSVLEFPVLMWFVSRQLKLPYLSPYRPVLLPTFIAFFVGFIAFLTTQNMNNLARLLWGASGVVGGYLLVMVFLECTFSVRHFDEVRKLWRTARAQIG